MKRYVKSAAVLLALCALTSCGAPDIGQFGDVKAELNYEDGTVTYPLDEYALTGNDARLVDSANAVLIERCMAQSGLDFPRANAEWRSIPPTPDRMFGLWSPRIAESYGYDLPPRDEALSELEAAKPESWWDAYRSCHDSAELLPAMAPLTGDPNNPSPVDRGYRESFQNTRGSSAFEDAKNAWIDCIAEQGLSAEDGPILVPVLPEGREQQLRVAIVDVGCKESLGTMQQIADVMAQYQAAYIDAHEGELAEFRQQAVDALNAAKEVLATSG